jgi:fibronectin-binding autotransporter adhesin
MSDCSYEFKSATILILVLLALTPAFSRAEAATQTLCVNPGGTAGCVATISDAVALITGSEATVTVAAGDYVDNVGINTELKPNKLTLTITGTAGAGSTTIDGNNAGPVFTIGSGKSGSRANATVTIDGLTIENGNNLGGSGGGIDTSGATLTINNCVVTNNQAKLSGAGISDIDGNLTINNSSITNNTGQAQGGGVSASGFTKSIKLSISGTTIDSNSSGSGGGIGFFPFLPFPHRMTGTIVNSTISNNTAVGDGGGIFVQVGSLKMMDSTISGNQATGDPMFSKGGGLECQQDNVTLNNVTVANNSATDKSGGIEYIDGGCKVVASNTIVADNIAPAGTDCSNCPPGGTCAGRFTSHDYNLIGNPTDCTLTGMTTHNLTGDSMLGPLQDNGGTTETQALSLGSPAAGTGNPAVPNGRGNHCLATDQIGTLRPKGNCDIGAYQIP